MFGIIRPCRARLGSALRDAWLAHLCGMCLALRDEHGHAARLVTNYDAVVVSALVEAQTGAGGRRRRAGPCALRGMRSASVATGESARLAATVSLLLAAAKLDDHLTDGDIDGPVRRRASRVVADRWATAGTAAAARVGLDGVALLEEVVGTRSEVETADRSLLEITAPTEAATALAFRQTAIVAGRPANADALAEAGRLFGRIAHLLDAVEDLHADCATGAWNPIAATASAPATVRAVCDDAASGVRLTLADAMFDDPRLVHALLVHELEAAVERTFATAGHPSGGEPPPPVPGSYPTAPPGSYPTAPPGAYPPGQAVPPGWNSPAPPIGPTRGPLPGCLGWLVACGTCQVCCAGQYADPCTGQVRRGACRSCGCGDACGEGGCECCCECAGDGCGDCCGECSC